jgi:hypothetical protein
MEGLNGDVSGGKDHAIDLTRQQREFGSAYK